MNTKRTWISVVLAVAVVSLVLAASGINEVASGGGEAASGVTSAPRERRDVDLVICLDTSGSMSGLIGSAKQKLWAIVNELATARPRPRLRVGLYHYGNDRLSRENGWVQRLCPLSDNLDKVYEELFKLRTNGGTEYVARVVRAATMELEWSQQNNALKIIVVAGNEPATQDGQYKLQDICRQAIGKGIIVNTIFCGPEAQGRKTGWADAARWADGQYAAIDQNRGTVVIKTPHDKKLAKLNEDLNRTYVAYGPGGAKGKARQLEQDKNAAKVNESSAAGRTVAKATALYSNATWDLVDALEAGKADLKTLKDEQLPAEMRPMKPAEREEHVRKMARKRRELQKQITELSAKRSKYQKEEMEKQGLDESKSFDANLRRAIRQQGEKKGMTFRKK